MEFTNMIKLGALGFKPDDIRKIKNSGIKSDEIIELAKNGYTPKDVEELISLASDEGGLQPKDGADENEPEKSSETDGDEKASDDKGTDPKDAEIEELKKKLEEDEKRIKDIQNKNASQNLGGAQPKSNRELVQEALRNLY